MSARLSGRVAAPDALTPAEEVAWGEMTASARHLHSPFLSLGYTRAVARAVPSVRICVISEEGRPVAFLPFQFDGSVRQALGWAERLGGEMSDYFGLVAGPDFRIEPERLLQLAGLRYLHFTHLEENQIVFGLSGERPETGFQIRLDDGGPAFWARLLASDKEFVKDTERRERQLARERGAPAFRVDGECAPGALGELIAHKRDQYARTAVEDALLEPWKTRLLEVLAETRREDCSGMLCTLHAGDTWVASHFGLRNRLGVLQYWFPVYNAELKRYAPGRLLLKSIIDRAAELGIRTIDRGAGDSPAKRDLANDSHVFYRGEWQRKGPLALVARGALAAQWRLEARLRSK
jgi:CelD/BcsL family acetyltransferase involved in cellulose biosynthesis